jgi:hypothetical protein
LKKVISILLVFLILLSSTGICFAIHYCPMSKKTTFSFTNVNTCCSKKGMTNKCCKNTKIQFEKIKDNYTPSQVSKTPTPQTSSFLLAYVQSFLSISIKKENRDLFLKYHVPPNNSVSLIILNRTILI